MKLLLISGALSTLLISGCASVMTAEQQTINVKTNAGQAIEVTVDDKTITAPGVVTVLRDGKDKVVRTNNTACDKTTPIKKKVAPAFFGNIIIGGLPGSTTDASTGKMWNYEDVEVGCSTDTAK
jgi:uncharacterized protein YceK